MIEVSVTASMLLGARTKAVEMGTLRNSIRSGAGNLIGFIGESIVQHVLGGRLANTYDYDLVLPDGTTVDVKSKATSVEPQPHYECSVAALNTKQKCDHYAFTRVKNDMSVGWYLGMIRKQDFYDKAKLFKKGEKIDSNKYVVRSDCYNLSISELG